MLTQAVDDGGQEPVELISQAEFARRVGVTPQAVSLAKRAGRFTAGAFAGTKIVWSVAREQWGRRRETRGGAFQPVAGASPAEAGQRSDLRDARLETERLRQEKLKRELAKDRDEFRPKAEVVRAAASVAGRIRHKMDSLVTYAPRLAADVEARGGGLTVAEARNLLKEMLRDLQREIADDLVAMADGFADEDDDGALAEPGEDGAEAEEARGSPG